MSPSERVAVRVCMADEARQSCLESALTHAGYVLVGEEPDILLADLAGEDVCGLIARTRQEAPGTLIVSTGAASCEGRIAEARAAGADAYYPTLAEPSALIEALGLLWAGACATRDSRARIGRDFEALLDPTTGALAEAHVYAHLVEEFARAGRAGESLGILMLDVDHYTEFTERHGEPAALELLRQVAELVLSAMPSCGSLGRLEDDKFLAVLPGAGLEAALEHAEAARRGVATAGVAVTLSVGVAALDEPGGTPDDLLRGAEAALYQAKVRGKDMVCS